MNLLPLPAVPDNPNPEPALADAAPCVFPVSFAQQRLWFLEQLEGPSPVYNVRLPVRLTGLLDVACLERGLAAVVARQESLRTTFGTRGAEPVQLVAPVSSVSLRILDLPGATETDLRDRLGTLASEPFDLRRGPLMRAFLLQLGPTDNVLLLVSHHIVSDAWSSGVLFRDLAAFYRSALLGVAPDLPELDIQYADFAVWQRDWLAGPELERQAAFWRQSLAGAPPVLNLPTDRPRPPVQTYRGNRQSLGLSAELTAGLKQLAGAEGVTLFMLLFAAFNVLLGRWSGQSDLVIGTPIAGRRRSELEGLVGFFANTLALRTDLAMASGFRDLLQQVRRTSLDAFAHQDLPFEKLVELLNPPRSLRHGPIFQVMFILQNAPWEADDFGGLIAAPAEIAPGDTARFELTLSVAEYEERLWLGLEYNTDLFDADTILRLAAGYEALLAAVVAEPEARLARLPVQSIADRQRVLEAFNVTGVPYPGDAGVYALFAAAARRTPAAIAVECGTEAWTYARLDAAVAGFSAALQAEGAGPESPVAICLDRSIPMLVAVLGALRAGVPYVPLDPTHPPARLAFILDDCGAGILVATPASAALLPAFSGRLLDGSGQPVPHGTAAPGAGRPVVTSARQPATGPAMAYLIYTSGSTGQPKGVMVPEPAVVNFLCSMAQQPGLAATDRLLAVTTLAFDIAALELLLPLTVGATTVIATRDEVADPERLLALLRDRRISVLQATPSLWRNLVTAGWTGSPSLKMLCGGEALDRELADQLRARGAELWNLYGPTETTIWSCCEPVGEGPVTVGTPIANTRCYVLDEQGEPVPLGVEGELWIGGDGVALGYHRRPELTAERFRAESLRDSGGLSSPGGAAGVSGPRVYRTGDRARFLADGRLVILGRTDFQVKLRGFRIEPGEIEALLLAHPAVRSAAVLLREVAGDPRLVAFVVPADGELAPAALADYLRDRVPGYMVPSTFVSLPSLPLTPNGKLDRAALPAPAAVASGVAAAVPPRTPLEAAIAGLFAEVLGVPAVGVEDDFFALGGHSLLATRLLARIRDALALEVPLKTLFLAPTVAGLAAALPASGVTAVPAIVVPPRTDRAPLSLVQQRLWFLDRLSPGNTVYNLAWAYELQGVLDPVRLQAAVDALVARHAILRTRVVAVDGEPHQEILPQLTVPVTVQPFAEAALAAQVEAPFDLTTGPLLRVGLFAKSPGEQVLLLVLHHIVADGWSLGILLRELSAFYAAAVRGDTAALAELPMQYAQYALWQREALAAGELRRQLDYWRGSLASAPPFLDLPLDRARPEVPTHRGARLHRMVPRPLQLALRELARAEGATLFMVLLAAFDVVLARYAGAEDVVVGTPVAGRPRTELMGLIGFFVNTLMLRTDLTGNPSFRELLRRVKEATLGAYAHPDLPFEQLVEALSPPRTTGRTPIFQVLFNLHNEPAARLELAGLELKPHPLKRSTAKFDLSVSVAENAQGMGLSFEYNTDIFLAPTMEQLAQDYVAVLAAIVASPEARLSGLCVAAVTPAVETGPSDDSDVLSAFHRQAMAHPGALAVSAAGSGGEPGVDLSYGQLAAESRAVGEALVRAGVGPGDRVGLWFGQGAGQVTGMLGVLMAGGCYVPLDPRAPDARLKQVVQDAGLTVVVSDGAALATYPWLTTSGLKVVTREAALGAAAGPAVSLPPADGQRLAYLLYTSGSTGVPKGVPQPQGHVLAQVGAWASNLKLGPADRLSLVSTYGYDAAVQDVFGALLTGASVHPLDIRATDRETLLDRIAGSGLTVLHATPTVYRYLFGGHVACRQDLSAVRLVVLGGEVARRSDLRLFESRFRKGAQFVNGYGLTEATAVSQWFAAHGTQVLGPVLPVGRAVGNQRVWLADETGAEAGILGEIVVESGAVTPGYWRGEPEAPARPGAVRRWRTGDVGRYLPDGNLLWVGRRDGQLKLGGIRIEPGEIEAALRAQAGIEAAVVLAVETEPGLPELVAVYQPGTVPEEALRAGLKTLLPEALRPARYLGVDALPLTPNGKLDQRVLRALAETACAPRPRGVAPGDGASPDRGTETSTLAGGSPPGDTIEATLQALWCTLLRREAIGPDEDFFALGGHSLLATRLIARVRDRLQVELPLIRIFETPTLRGLAEAVRRLTADPAPPNRAIPIPRQARPGTES